MSRFAVRASLGGRRRSALGAVLAKGDVSAYWSFSYILTTIERPLLAKPEVDWPNLLRYNLLGYGAIDLDGVSPFVPSNGL